MTQIPEYRALKRRALRGFALLFALTLLPLGAGLLPSCGPKERRPCRWDEYAEDCQHVCQPPTACVFWDCPGDICSWDCNIRDRPIGTPCAEDGGISGVCNELSECVACVDDTQCGDGGFCWKNTCVRCDDGIQNGDETAVDCGGKCGLCLGTYCNTADECASGMCSPAGRCCNEPCDTGCYYCPKGTCVPIPAGFKEDYSGCKPFDEFCNGKGECALGPNKPCTKPEDCASSTCINGLCGGF
jgi:hypothetical protein